MKKIILLTATLVFLAFTSYSQTVLYDDDFESYTVGEYLAVQSSEWTTWSGAPGTDEDALITDAESYSPDQSVIVDGSTDLVKPLGDKTSGKYEIIFYYYVPGGYYAYYNIQHFEQPGVEWALEVFFEDGGNGYINAGGENAATFTYSQDQWIEIKNIVDLTNDSAQLVIEGTWVHGWQFSLKADGGEGELQLGSVNCYAWAPSGETPMYYFDDFLYQQVPVTLFEDDFESYTSGGYLCVQSDWWETWSNNPGSNEDGIISDDEAHSPSQSLLVEGSTDIIGPFGNKTSGKYQVDFYYYIKSGYSGYFNFQHYEEPGVEWAMEVFFGESEEGYLDVGGNRYFFDYNQEEWLYIKNIIDIDEDNAELYINDILIHEWPWHYTATGTDGENQLGGIDIYAGGPQGETPKYYMDDFAWYEITASTDPIIEVTPSTFEETVEPGNTKDETLTVSNVGYGDLEYNTEIIYDIGEKSKAIQQAEPQIQKQPKRLMPAKDPDPTPGGPNYTSTRDNVTFHYDGDNSNAIGLTNGGQWEVAAKFPNDMVLEYAGLEIVSVDVYINTLCEEFELRIYGEGEYSYTTGDLLYSETFSPTAESWNTITIDEPVTITGEDIWVGYWMDQQTPEIFIAGVDEGPADDNGDWIRTGVGWGHLSDNPDLNYNWNIRAYAEGDPITQWLSVDPDSGTVPPDDQDDLTVTFDATELEIGTYGATIQVNSNDPEQHLIEVPCIMDVLVGVNELGENNAVIVYPNPVMDYINIKANHNINKVRMMNYLGQKVFENNVNSDFVRINSSDLETGVYILQINTDKGQTTKQIVVE